MTFSFPIDYHPPSPEIIAIRNSASKMILDRRDHGDKMEMLETLPNELKLLILESAPDLDTLRNLLHASPTYYRLFYHENKQYGAAVMAKVVGSQPRPLRDIINLTALFRSLPFIGAPLPHIDPINQVLGDLGLEIVDSPFNVILPWEDAAAPPPPIPGTTPPQVLRGLLSTAARIGVVGRNCLAYYLEGLRAASRKVVETAPPTMAAAAAAPSQQQVSSPTVLREQVLQHPLRHAVGARQPDDEVDMIPSQAEMALVLSVLWYMQAMDDVGAMSDSLPLPWTSDSPRPPPGSSHADSSSVVLLQGSGHGDDDDPRPWHERTGYPREWVVRFMRVVAVDRSASFRGYLLGDGRQWGWRWHMNGTITYNQGFLTMGGPGGPSPTDKMMFLPARAAKLVTGYLDRLNEGQKQPRLLDTLTRTRKWLYYDSDESLIPELEESLREREPLRSKRIGEHAVFLRDELMLGDTSWAPSLPRRLRRDRWMGGRLSFLLPPAITSQELEVPLLEDDVDWDKSGEEGEGFFVVEHRDSQ